MSHNNKVKEKKEKSINKMVGLNIYDTKTNHCKYLFLRIKTQDKRKINQINGLTK